MNPFEHSTPEVRQANQNIIEGYISVKSVNIYQKLAELTFAKNMLWNIWHYLQDTRNNSKAATTLILDHIVSIDAKIKNYKAQIEDMPVVTNPYLGDR